MHHGGIGREALRRLAGGDAIVGGNEGQGDVVGDFTSAMSVVPILPIARDVEPAARVAGGNRGP